MCIDNKEIDAEKHIAHLLFPLPGYISKLTGSLLMQGPILFLIYLIYISVSSPFKKIILRYVTHTCIYIAGEKRCTVYQFAHIYLEHHTNH